MPPEETPEGGRGFLNRLRRFIPRGPARKEPTPPNEPPKEPPTIFRFSRQFADMNLERRGHQRGNDFEQWLQTTQRGEDEFTDESLAATLREKGADFRKAKPAFWYRVEHGTLEQALTTFNQVLSSPPENVRGEENNLFIRPDIALDTIDLILRRDAIRDGRQALTAQEEGALQSFFTNIFQMWKKGSAAFSERRQVDWYEPRIASSLVNLFNDHSEFFYGLGGKPFLEIMSEVKSKRAFDDLVYGCRRLSPKEAAISLVMSVRIPELLKAHTPKITDEQWEAGEMFRDVVHSLRIALDNRKGELSEEDRKAVTIFLRFTDAALKPTMTGYNYAFFMTDFYEKYPEFKEATLSKNPLAEEIDLPAIKKGLVENPLKDPFWEDLKAKPPHKNRRN